MPTNLNALIRYKQIDSCLKNNRYGCSFFDLIEACSDALEEFRGTGKRISDRTLYDDLRVMKSEILGFNAPIEFDDGKYYYSDSEFTIFSAPIKELDILKEVFDLLTKKKQELEDKAVDSILSRIGNIIKENDRDALSINERLSSDKQNDDFISMKQKSALISTEQKTDPIKKSLKITKEDDGLLYSLEQKLIAPSRILMLWDDILEVI